MELVFKLEYCPVKKEKFNRKVEKQKNKVHCDLFAYSNSAYSNHKKTFYTLYEKIKFVTKKGLGFCGLKLELICLKGFFLLKSRKSYSNRCLKPRHTIQHQWFTLITLPLLNPLFNWPQIPMFGSTEGKTPT